jgi:ABC-type branched-subunit amino acid transport system substrate-binding protein
MESSTSTAAGYINLGAVAYREGRLDEARALFVRALLTDHENERAWLWLATVATDPDEQRYCLNRALEINPESSGLRRRVLLPPGPAVVPPELIELDHPPLPPDLADVRTPTLPMLPRTARERRQRAQASRVVSGAGDGTDADIPLPAAAPPRLSRSYWLLPLLALVLLVAAGWLTSRNQGAPAPDDYVIAYAGPLTGEDAAIGQEQLQAVQLAVAEQNARGGIGGHKVRVESFDDGNDPARASQIAETLAADDQILLVIGHDRSEATAAAAPAYEQAGLTVISPSSTADTLGESQPWVFRAIFTNRTEGAFSAEYARHALEAKTASIVSTPGDYETSLANAFADQFSTSGEIRQRWDLDPKNRDASIDAVVSGLRDDPEPGVLFLALEPADAHALLLALGRADLQPTMLGGEALGFDEFADLFAAEPEAQEQPGFFTDGLYVVSPLLYDSLGGNALEFAQRYGAAFGSMPDWLGAKAYDATALGLYTLSTLDGANPANTPAADLRQQVQRALAGLIGGDESVPGLEGPLSFNQDRSVRESLSIGVFDLGSLQSASLQYRPTSPGAVSDLDAELASGQVFDLNGEYFRQYRVVYVGVGINGVSEINVQNQTFDADFFLWFRYQGDEDAEDVFFINAEEPDTPLPDPIERSEVDDEHFAMYRIDSTFNQPMDFRNYPWDKHTLNIGLQNVSLSEEDVVYVPDQSNLRQTQAERLSSGVDVTRPFNQVPSWIATRVLFTQDTATTRGTVPDPRSGAPELRSASTYNVQMAFERDVRSFLIKNLLPLALLALVTYISLFFSPESAGTRIGFSITSILTTSVLLQSISSNLPDIGYTVAIEWGFYIYIGLSALLVLVNITIERWYKARRYAAVAQLDRIARITYPVVILAVVTAYAVRFG